MQGTITINYKTGTSPTLRYAHTQSLVINRYIISQYLNTQRGVSGI